MFKPSSINTSNHCIKMQKIKQTALNEAVQKFYKDSATMSASLKEVKRTDLQKQVQDLSGMDQKIQNQFEQKRQELSLPIQKKLQAAIEEVAKENGYTYVFPKRSINLYASYQRYWPVGKKKTWFKRANYQQQLRS